MKKAKIYIPTKSAMQSGKGKTKKWLLEFETKDPKVSSLMGWESTNDTLGELKMEFSSREKAEDYAKKNNIYNTHYFLINYYQLKRRGKKFQYGFCAS